MEKRKWIFADNRFEGYVYGFDEGLYDMTDNEFDNEDDFDRHIFDPNYD